MYHLITTSQGCHNGASMVINGAYLPPQECLFTLCHHSRPSLPQNLMVLEVPFIPLSLSLLSLCVSSPFRSPNQSTGHASWVLGLTSEPPSLETPSALFWASVPLAKANQTPGGSRRVGATGGLIVFPFTSQISGHQTLSLQPHTLQGQFPHKVTAPIARGMHVNREGSKKHAKKPGTLEYYPSTIYHLVELLQQQQKITVKQFILMLKNSL